MQRGVDNVCEEGLPISTPDYLVPSKTHALEVSETQQGGSAMTKWHERFLGLAQCVSTWSRDPSTRVGCCIADSDNRIVSVGYNGFSKGVKDEGIADMPRDERLRRTIHAEDNAILFAARQLDGCTIYVTHAPCARCTAKIIQAGIRRLVTYWPAEEFAARWADEFSSAAVMLDEAQVKVIYYEEPV